MCENEEDYDDEDDISAVSSHVPKFFSLSLCLRSHPRSTRFSYDSSVLFLATVAPLLPFIR